MLCYLCEARCASDGIQSAQCVAYLTDCPQLVRGWNQRRAITCMQAEQRQQKFDQSAGGRAARKAVAEVARDRQAGRPDNDQMAKDWVN